MSVYDCMLLVSEAGDVFIRSAPDSATRVEGNFGFADSSRAPDGLHVCCTSESRGYLKYARGADASGISQGGDDQVYAPCAWRELGLRRTGAGLPV
jgi:hypothetical protein